jgi:hypothetical protein
MTRFMTGFALGALLVAALPAGAAAQAVSAAQCATLRRAPARRPEGLRLAHLINAAESAQHDSPLVPRTPGRKPQPYLGWDAIGASTTIAMWKTDGGPSGDLARNVRWGADEPLPGWRMHWMSDADHYAFTLTDMCDATGFAYVSDERGRVLQARDTEPAAVLRPVESQ